MSTGAPEAVAVLDTEPSDLNYPWRHPLPNGWRKVRLGDLIEIVRGISFPKDAKVHEPRKGYVACLRTTNVQRDVEWEDLWFVPEKHVKRDEQYVRPGDILISTANSYELVGKVASVTSMPYAATLGAFISLLRPKGELDSKFGYYQIAWSDTQDRIRSTASTTTNISNVSTKKLSNIELAIPPFDQQKRIVEEIEKQFSRLDEAVADLKRVKANLKHYKAAVLKAAVEGRLVGTSGGSVQRESLGNLGDWCGGGTPSKAVPGYWAGGEIPWVSPKDMKTDVISDAADHITAMAVNNSATHLLPKGAVLVVTRSGILRHTLPVAITTAAVAINQDLKALQPSDNFDPRYIALALRARQHEILHECSKEGTTVQSIEFPRFLRYEIPVPPLDDQMRIVDEVERRLSLILETDTQVDTNLQRADQLRQSVLSTLFNGRLKFAGPG